MRKFVLGVGILWGAACQPGSGEYGKCSTTPDCQINLVCYSGGNLDVNDAGNTYADAGVCRYPCTVSANCNGFNNSEVCGFLSGGLGLCSADGGY